MMIALRMKILGLFFYLKFNYNKYMKITPKKNVKAKVSIPTKPSKKTEFAMKHPPNLKPKNKRAK